MTGFRHFFRDMRRSLSSSLGLALAFHALLEIPVGLVFLPFSGYLLERILPAGFGHLDSLFAQGLLSGLPELLVLIFLLGLWFLFSLYRYAALVLLVGLPEISTLRSLAGESARRLFQGLKRQSLTEGILLFFLPLAVNPGLLLSLYVRLGLERLQPVELPMALFGALAYASFHALILFAYPRVILEGEPLGKAVADGFSLYRRRFFRNTGYYLASFLTLVLFMLLLFLGIAALGTVVELDNGTTVGVYGMSLSILRRISGLGAMGTILLFNILISFFGVQLYTYCTGEEEEGGGTLPLVRRSSIPYLLLSLFLLGVVLGAGYLAPTLVPNEYIRYGSYFTPAYPEIIAHRGFSAIAPENTLAAVKAAISADADRVEVDVQLSREGEVFLMHDQSLERTTGVRGRILDFSQEEISLLDAGSWFSPDFAGEGVPSLREVLRLCKGKIALKIELKPVKGVEALLADAVLRIVREEGMSSSVMISSFSQEALERVRKVDGKIISGLIATSVAGPYDEIAYADALVVNQTFLTLDQTGNIKGSGKLLYAWTANSTQEIQAMWRLGVDGIITDYPRRARVAIYGDTVSETFRNILYRIVVSLTDPLRY